MIKHKKLKILFTIFFHVSFVIYALVSTAGPLMLGNASVINNIFHIQTQFSSGSNVEGNVYFDTAFKNMEEVKAASLSIIE